MKERKNIFFVIILCFVMLFLGACRTLADADSNEDLPTLESCLTTEYDLDALRTFFQSSNMGEAAGFNEDAPLLTFDEVDQVYPVELTRVAWDGYRSYSVYKVCQGGYFYVFWSIEMDIAADGTPCMEKSVVFSAYLHSDTAREAFDAIVPGSSTAEDVKRIDPYVELSFLYSSGIYSFSYLDSETLLFIEYERPVAMKEYADLIVKEVTTVSRANTSSHYGIILSSDLP